MNRPISQDRIDTGRKLKAMKDDEGFKLLNAYIEERMSDLCERTMGHSGPAGDVARDLYGHQELSRLLGWIEDEIEAGGKELLRQAKEEKI